MGLLDRLGVLEKRRQATIDALTCKACGAGPSVDCEHKAKSRDRDAAEARLAGRRPRVKRDEKGSTPAGLLSREERRRRGIGRPGRPT